MRLRMLEFGGQFMVLKILAVFLIIILVLMKLPVVPRSGLLGNFYFLSILGIFVAVLFPTFVTGVLDYGQSPIELIRLPLLYNGLFIFAILFIYRSNSKLVVQLNGLIIAMGMLGVLFAICLSFYPDIAPRLLTKSAIFQNRFDRPRFSSSLGGETYAIFFLLAALTKFKQSRRTKIFRIVALLVFAYYMLFVYMGRGYMITIFLTSLIYFVFCCNFHKSLSLVIGLLIIVFAIGVFTDHGILGMVENHWQSTKDGFQYREGNVGNRMDGICYYTDKFRETGYIGIGMLSSTRATNTDIVLTMLVDRYNPSDIGIFGAFSHFGFPAIILIIIILKRMFGDLAFVIREGKTNHQLIATTLQMLLIQNIVGAGNMFFWHKSSLEWGLYFFMAWKLRDLTRKRMNIEPSTIEKQNSKNAHLQLCS